MCNVIIADFQFSKFSRLFIAVVQVAYFYVAYVAYVEFILFCILARFVESRKTHFASCIGAGLMEQIGLTKPHKREEKNATLKCTYPNRIICIKDYNISRRTW